MHESTDSPQNVFPCDTPSPHMQECHGHSLYPILYWPPFQDCSQSQLVCLFLPCLKLVSFCCLLLYYCLSLKVKLSQVVPGMPPLPVRPTEILLSPPTAGEDGQELSRCLYVPSSYYESTTTVLSLLRLSFQLQILAAIPKSSAVLNLFQISLVPRNLFELLTTCVIT